MDGAQTLTGERTAAVRILWAPIAGVIATVSVFAVAQGLAYPLLSFILERQGTSSLLIGLSAAMTPCGLIASAPAIPFLSRRFGAGRTALTCAASAAVLLALIGWTQDLLPWFPLRFLLGAAIGPLYVISEVWLLALAPPERRGRIIGIYTAVISAGFAAGPLSLMVVGANGWPPFLIGIAAFIAASLCVAVTLPRLPDLNAGGEHASVRTFMPLAPVLLLAVAAVAVFEQNVLSLMPIYGLAHGVGEAGTSAILAVLSLGNIALQIPLGLAADRWGARTPMVLCAGLTALGCAALPAVIGSGLVWPFAFFWGALAYGIYTLAIVEVGGRFTGPMLVAANAAFALMWGVGGIAGPPLTGAAMDAAGVEALPAILGVACLALAAAALARRGAERPSGVAN